MVARKCSRSPQRFTERFTDVREGQPKNEVECQRCHCVPIVVRVQSDYFAVGAHITSPMIFWLRFISNCPSWKKYARCFYRVSMLQIGDVLKDNVWGQHPSRRERRTQETDVYSGAYPSRGVDLRIQSENLKVKCVKDLFCSLSLQDIVCPAETFCFHKSENRGQNTKCYPSPGGRIVGRGLLWDTSVFLARDGPCTTFSTDITLPQSATGFLLKGL